MMIITAEYVNLKMKLNIYLQSGLYSYKINYHISITTSTHGNILVAQTTFSLVAYSDFWFRLKKVGIRIGIRKIIGITPEHFGMSLCHSMPISILTQYVRAVTYLIIINLLYSHTM